MDKFSNLDLGIWSTQTQLIEEEQQQANYQNLGICAHDWSIQRKKKIISKHL